MRWGQGFWTNRGNRKECEQQMILRRAHHVAMTDQIDVLKQQGVAVRVVMGDVFDVPALEQTDESMPSAYAYDEALPQPVKAVRKKH